MHAQEQEYDGYQYAGNEFEEETEAFMVNFVGSGGPNPWQSKVNGKSKTKFEGACWPQPRLLVGEG